MDWTPWAIGGGSLAVTIIGIVVKVCSNSHRQLHKRVDTTRDNCKESYADKEQFVDFRKETRKGFETLNTKVDGIPLAVKTLLDKK